MADTQHEKQIEEIYPYPGKARSAFWKFFGFRKKIEGPLIRENLEMSTVICKLCHKSYVNKGAVPKNPSNAAEIPFPLPENFSHQLIYDNGSSTSRMLVFGSGDGLRLLHGASTWFMDVGIRRHRSSLHRTRMQDHRILEESTEIAREQSFRSTDNESGTNGVSRTQPKHPRYQDENSRTVSYYGNSMIISLEEAVKSGFFHTGEGDCLVCYYCGIDLKNWKEGDDPMKEHITHSPNCPIVQRKGSEYTKKTSRTKYTASSAELSKKCSILEYERNQAVEYSAELLERINQLEQENERLRAENRTLRQQDQVALRDIDPIHNARYLKLEPRGNHVTQETTMPIEVEETECEQNDKQVEIAEGGHVDDQRTFHDDFGARMGFTRMNLAVQSCLKKGYPMENIMRAVEMLKKAGNLSPYGLEICQKMKEMDENHMEEPCEDEGEEADRDPLN